LAIAACGLVLAATARERLQINLPLTAAIGLLLGWATISFVWADDPGICLRRLIVLVCCTVGALGIARQLSMRELSLLTIIVLGSLAVVGIFAELRLGTFRPWAGDYRFAGTVHPNTQGPALAAVCLAALGLFLERSRGRFWYGAIFLGAMILLLLTKSRSSTAGVLLAIAAVFAVQTTLRLKLAVGLVGFWGACLGAWLVLAAGIDPLTEFADAILLGRAAESDTLSGRAFIWPEVASFIAQRPILGYGYEAFWTPARIETISESLGWGLREAHNAYLETLLWLGLVGLVLTLATVGLGLAASIRSYRQLRDPTFALPLGMLVFGLINAGLESGIVAIELVTLILGCCLLRMALFNNRQRESGIKNQEHVTHGQ
jgi:exopolysaccharide production protein ExoQ